MDGTSVTATHETTRTTHDPHGFDDGMRRRLAAALRERYPHDTAKLVSRDTEASPRTVEGWLMEAEPRAPGADHLATMFKAYGPAFTAFVCLPETEWARRERQAARIAALERDIAALKEGL